MAGNVVIEQSSVSVVPGETSTAEIRRFVCACAGNLPDQVTHQAVSGTTMDSVTSSQRDRREIGTRRVNTAGRARGGRRRGSALQDRSRARSAVSVVTA